MLNAVSLFSGCGGLDLGLKDAGFKIIAANDSNPLAVKTYQKNIGNEIVLGDIRESETRNSRVARMGRLTILSTD